MEADRIERAPWQAGRYNWPAPATVTVGAVDAGAIATVRGFEARADCVTFV